MLAIQCPGPVTDSIIKNVTVKLPNNKLLNDLLELNQFLIIFKFYHKNIRLISFVKE